MSLTQPIQYTAKYYAHTDDGAPVLTSTDGAIKNILKACLIDGYGTKEGAGWELLFDSAFSSIYKMPQILFNAPNIKIENGNSKHAITSQSNDVLSIDDTTFDMISVNFVGNDSSGRTQWHMIVTDIGFVLCYEMGYSTSTYIRNNILYVGATQKWLNNDNVQFVATHNDSITTDGIGKTGLRYLFDSKSAVINIETGSIYRFSPAALLSLPENELYYNNDYMVQKVSPNMQFSLPFYTSVPAITTDTATSIVSINNQNMLRYFNSIYALDKYCTLYIPLDYWEI